MWYIVSDDTNGGSLVSENARLCQGQKKCSLFAIVQIDKYSMSEQITKIKEIAIIALSYSGKNLNIVFYFKNNIC